MKYLCHGNPVSQVLNISARCRSIERLQPEDEAVAEPQVRGLRLHGGGRLPPPSAARLTWQAPSGGRSSPVSAHTRPCLQTPGVAAGSTNHGEEVALSEPIAGGYSLGAGARPLPQRCPPAVVVRGLRPAAAGTATRWRRAPARGDEVMQARLLA